jgi:hypothetical protein
MTKIVALFVALCATKKERQFATLCVQRLIPVSENIITSLPRIGGIMKGLLLSTMTALLLAILLASTAFAAPAAAQKEFVLKGTFEARETQQVVPPLAMIDATGVGNSTQLGRFTYSLQAELFLPTLTAQVTATLIAAKGDMIFGEGVGQGTPTGTPGTVSIVETFTITGGTGRFEGASGNFTVERLINLATLASSGTLSGQIVLP